MGYMLTAAADIASGMAFLHARGIVHGDLTGGNVLLATDPSSRNGVVAKVADFGLARSMEVQSKIETRTYGTVTHMPPELLEKGIFSKVSGGLPDESFSLGYYMSMDSPSKNCKLQIAHASHIRCKALFLWAPINLCFQSFFGWIPSRSRDKAPGRNILQRQTFAALYLRQDVFLLKRECLLATSKRHISMNAAAFSSSSCRLLTHSLWEC